MRTSVFGIFSVYTALQIVHALETVTPSVVQSNPDKGSGRREGEKIFCDFYNPWSHWSKCNKHCVQARKRLCKFPEMCGQSRIKEKRQCNKKYRPCKEVTYKVIGSTSSNRKKEDLLYDLFYKPWTRWGSCSKTCKKRRRRRCKGQFKDVCGGGYLEEERICRTKNASCQGIYTFHNISEEPASNKDETNYTLKAIQKMCGERPPGVAGSYRIVGGTYADLHSWPWQVALVNRKKKHLCGGTLLAPKWVLTAAHCILKKDKKRKEKRMRTVQVRVGEHDRSVKNNFREDYKVAKYFPHKAFIYEFAVNDIALLQLKRPVRISNTTGFACLPTKSQKVRHRTMCKVLGWGRTGERRTSTILREADVPIVKKRKCKKAFSFTITNSRLCAGYRKGGIDSCIGDSGGPLMCPFTKNANDSAVRWFVNGVTSYGEGCGVKGKYGIYTNVSKYVNWIKKTIEEN